MFTFPFTNFSGAGFVNTYSTVFNGVDEVVETSKNNVLDNLSIFAWIKVGNTTTTRAIVSDEHTGLGQRSISFNVKNSGYLRLELSDGGSYKKTLDTTVSLEDGLWHHVGFTFDSSATPQAKVFVDGVKQVLTGTDNTMGALHQTLYRQLNIGNKPVSANWFEGSIDEVTIWKDAIISESEAATFYNSGIPTDPTNLSTSATLSSWYRMGDGDIAGTIYDNAGSLDGTAVNMDATNYSTDVPS